MDMNKDSIGGSTGILDPVEQTPPSPAPAGTTQTSDRVAPVPYLPVTNGAETPLMPTNISGSASPPLLAPISNSAPVSAPPSQRTSTATWIVLGLIGFLVLAAGLLISVIVAGRSLGQIVNQSVGNLTVDKQSIALGTAKTASIDLRMNAGNVTIRGGAQNLMDATFTYNVQQWKPEVKYDVSGDTGSLSVAQPDNKVTAIGNTKNDWELQMKNDVPTTLSLNLGAGNAQLALGGMNLSSLNIDNHSGNTTVDLTGAWKNNLDARITGAVGNTVMRLPSDVGVRVATSSVIGKVDANGFTKNGNVYTNEAYGKSPVTLNIDATVSVGNLTLETTR